ncbi:hypothetical protein GWK47_013944 [Chionoecetes opilio]|uniref:G domain-containing protein n=1 Tax=Chionoecetes opilio TaxID=41210 RepID=A0A8J4XXF6_CHIOP|nr:hypothetical protein GWK47_013944 [Chionoecetes opilio]KAG0714534.1 hypothetical protein GWK47_013944 [Chionoecetes opilio]
MRLQWWVAIRPSRYIEEHVQRTGVAIETQGFSFVTNGRKRESLTGNATLHLYPHFKSLQDIEGVVDYLNTEISTSKQKKFSLVTFIDTPGLVDGDMKYPFDVNETILWLGDLCDLLFVFFDPIGQALCKRTLNIVERLNETHSDRIRFYLSKADDAGQESDRQSVPGKVFAHLLLTRIRSHLLKHQRPQQSGFTPGKSTTDRILALCVLVERRLIFAESLEVLVMALEGQHEEAKPLGLEVSWLKTKVQVFGDLLDEAVQVLMQIVQELCKRPGLNKTGFDMPTIYIPNPNKPSRCTNQIEEVCKDIEKTINQTIQNTLNQLERDCEQISSLVDRAIKLDDVARKNNFRAKMRGMGLSLFGLLLPVLLVVQLLVASAPRQLLINLIGDDMADALVSYMAPTTGIWEMVDEENQLVILACVLAASGLCLIVSRFFNRSQPTLQRRSKKALLWKQEYVNTNVKPEKQKLYSEYLQQSVSEHDL